MLRAGLPISPYRPRANSLVNVELIVLGEPPEPEIGD